MPAVHDRYTVRVHVAANPDLAETQVRAALADEGFGVLTEIDVDATLKDKIDKQVGPYKILGACAPPMAFDAISADPAIGALLPCNVVVRAHPEGGSEVIAVDAHAMMGIAEVDDLHVVAGEVAERLERVLDVVAGA